MSRQPFNPLDMPLEGIRLIEASAGTGKTFSLAGLYLRLIVEKQVPVREILVITFTRAATQELRERIRKRLAEAAQRAQNPAVPSGTTEDLFAEALIAASTDPRDAVARRLADAAHRMDEATITTIHGFSQRAAAENAFDSGLAFDRGEQVDDRAVYDEVVADYWRAHALGADATIGFVEWWNNPAALEKELSPLRSRPHASLAGPANKRIAKQTKEFRTLWRKQNKPFLKEFRECCSAGVFSQAKNDKLKVALEKAGGLDDAIALLTERIESEQAIPALPEWTAHLHDPGGRILKTRDPERGAALFDQPLARELCRLQPLARLAALRDAHEQIETMAGQRKRERRQFSFADMIAALHEAIIDADHGQRLADALHATWPWTLVDEFQDTDPLQYEILHRVHANRDNGALLLIGDPKQAIYGFRGGDVFAYLDAAADAGANSYSLDTNYRSTQGLLDAIETVFRTPGKDAFLVDGIEYQTVTAGRKSQRTLLLDDKPCAPMTLWHLAPKKSNKDAAELACRDACVTRIRQLLDPINGGTIERRDAESGKASKTPVQPRDIAVLVNKNAEAADMQRALSRVGIAAVCLHQASVFASSEARDVLHVLKAAASPADEGLLRGALAGDLLGCRLGDLIAMADDDNQQRWLARIDQFQHARQNWRSSGVLALLQPMIQQAAVRLLAYEDGERRVSNYLQLAELLAAAESETFGMNGLLRWLRQAMHAADNNQGSEAEQLRLESDEALVRITTVHKAKGLEYPIVLLAFAPWLGSMGYPDKPPHAFHDKNNQACIDILGEQQARDQAVREQRAEGLRVLYVALTRAEIACFLPWVAANGTPNSALASLLHREDGITADLWVGKAASKPLDKDVTAKRLETLAGKAPKAIAIESLPKTAANNRTLTLVPEPTGKARSDLPEPRLPWSIYSFTRLAHAATDGPANAGADDEIDVIPLPTDTDTTPLPELPGGTAFGSAVHAILENAAPEDWPAPPAALQPAQLATVADALRCHGIALAATKTDVIVKRSAELIRNTLYTPLPDIGPLAALEEHQRLREMEFMLRLGDNKRGSKVGAMLDLLDAHGYGQALPRERRAGILQGLMHGFIDLVAEHDGRYYVIDYKSNWLGDHAADYTPAALKNAIRRRHYDLQYLIYVTALHRFLRQRLADYDPAQHLGGAQYLFVRAMDGVTDAGVFTDRPNVTLIGELDALFDGARQTSRATA